MKLKFLGAAKNVTGSKYLLTTPKSSVLVDCGLFQEREFKTRNWEPFPVDPRKISHLFLTHAHVDHCGYLPKLVKDGFRGEVICTSPTAEIAQIVLLDTAHLQEADAAFKKRRHQREKRKGPFPEIPLYGVEDARKIVSYFRPVDYGKEIKVTNEISVTFHDAGHILGSAMLEVRVKEEGSDKTIIFSGDIGRWNRPILKDPSVFEKADYVVMESTYGNRDLENTTDAAEKLRQVILETEAAGGNVIIPTFAIERAQEIIYDLDKFFNEKKLPPIPVFVDSPMANQVTEIFKKFWAIMDEEVQELKQKGETLFSFRFLKMITSQEESEKIAEQKGTSVIMAGSGMCTGGRIKQHLVNNISQPESTILFVGYQAEGTLGRTILEKPKRVRILGQEYPVRARIEKINGFSAHADRQELFRWISSFQIPPKTIFIVHGEPVAELEFAQRVKQHFASEILIPKYLEEFRL